jgi:hypothetical protein
VRITYVKARALLRKVEMKRRICERCLVVASEGQVSSDLAGEMAILDVKSGIYYGLNAVGTYVWHLTGEPKAVSAVRDALLEEYDVEPERCERDLLALLQELADKGLIEIKDEAEA